jgi:hypothetical protein
LSRCFINGNGLGLSFIDAVKVDFGRSAVLVAQDFLNRADGSIVAVPE